MMDYCPSCGQWHDPGSTACQTYSPIPSVANVTPPPDPTPALWEIAAQLRRIADALEVTR
jgi:hypothetical protein